MKQIAEIVALAETLNDLLQNPAALAELYANLDSVEQAAFWDLVAFQFEQFGGAKGCQQNCMIADGLSGRAKEHIRNLFQHIELMDAI